MRFLVQPLFQLIEISKSNKISSKYIKPNVLNYGPFPSGFITITDNYM